jgi:tetratricopeptide (TPR) repeat protein
MLVCVRGRDRSFWSLAKSVSIGTPVTLARSEIPPPSRLPKTRLFQVAVLWLALFNTAGTLASEPVGKNTPPQDAARLVRQYKQSGDVHVAGDDLEKAADAYSKALDLGRSSFSVAERIQMAVRLSWADRLSRAERELRSVLELEPNNRDARIPLARVLSWTGELTEAIHEADEILRQFPDNREALQIKADALQWKGDLRRAIPLYTRLIQKQDDFDARLGLSYSLLFAGDRTGAEQSRQLLKPTTTNQQNRFSKFVDTFESAVQPKLDLQYLYFNDSDGNLLDRYGVSQSFWLDNFDLAASFRHTEARDDTRRNSGEDFSFKAYTHPTESFALGGKLGFTRLRDGNSSNFLAGEIKLDAKVRDGTVGTSVTREVLTDSAELIEKRIRATIAGLRWSQQLTDRFSVHPAYWYRSFSDANHAHDAQFTSQYLLSFSPKLALGHRFRYLNYNRQSGGGYFDPNDYYSNRLFATFYIERQRFYLFSDIFVGQQAFKRNGVASNDLAYGGAGSIGYRPIRNLVLEFYVEGGQLAAGTASDAGYSYLLLGPRCLIRF